MQTKIFGILLVTIISFGFWPNSEQLPLEEICNNAVDDDGDQLIDLNDPDCDCQPPVPPSLVPNPSFEETNCCPSGNRQLSCADTWIQASEATTDYYHRCDYFMRDQFPVPLPIPDGDAYIGFRNGRFSQNPNPNWKEYTGACLLSPLKAGTRYTFQFSIGFVNSSISPPMNVVIYGTTDCKNLPFGEGDSEFGCPTNGPGWQELGRVFVSGSARWIQYEIIINTEEDMVAMAIGPDCLELNLSVNPYYFLDNLILANTELFGPTIEGIGHPCSDDFTLMSSEKRGATYQWYKEGIAIVGATERNFSPRRQGGDYQVLTMTEDNCLLSDFYSHNLPSFNESTQITVCQDETFQFGNRVLSNSGQYTATFPDVNNCDSIVFLDLTVLSGVTDTLEDYFLKGETYRVDPYIFNNPVETELILTSSLGCDSLVHLILKEYPLYIPTAFSPNGDGINDVFTLYGGDDLISIQTLKIFDRWGNQVFRQIDVDGEFTWDGRYQQKSVKTGVYIYVIDLILNDGEMKTLKGGITVVK